MMVKEIWKRLMELQLRAGKTAEDSISLRILTFAVVVAGILAVYSEEYFNNNNLPLIAILLSAVGYITSYFRRHDNNWLLKTFLAIGMVLAGYISVKKMMHPGDERLITLTELMIWLLILHSFDLPRRQDLTYSILSALMLLSVGAALNRSIMFAIPLAIFSLLSIFLLITFHFRELNFQVKLEGKIFRLYKLILPVVLLSSISAAIFFIFLPRFQTAIMFSIPIPIRFSTPKSYRGEIQSPMIMSKLGYSGLLFNFYFIGKNGNRGLEPILDLNQRPIVDNSILMRVKSRYITYYRGLVFDKYSGDRWTLTDLSPEKIYRDKFTNKITLKMGEETIDRSQMSIPTYQTFFIEKELPYLVYAAYLPSELYFPSPLIYQDKENSIRAPIALPGGTVYTVISKILTAPTYILKNSSEKSFLNLTKYLKLPIIPDRVRKLAESISSSYEKPYDKLQAISDYLKKNYKYNLHIPSYPKNSDVVDYFLFNSREGYCQHFATALAVMGRSIGIATRLATGFSNGDYNQFTGHFEVRGKDAHAWVEAYFSPYGWIPFEATPGFNSTINDAVYHPYKFIYEKMTFWFEKINQLYIVNYKNNLLYAYNKLTQQHLLFITIILLTILILYFFFKYGIQKVTPKNQKDLIKLEEDKIRTLFSKMGYKVHNSMTIKEIFTKNIDFTLPQSNFLLDFCNIFYKIKYNGVETKYEDIGIIKKYRNQTKKFLRTYYQDFLRE